MSYINVDNNLDGILSLIHFDPGTGRLIADLAQTLMRRPSPLSIGERELIAAYVSKLNSCKFCCDAHTACAEATSTTELVNSVLENTETVEITPRLRCILNLVESVVFLDREKIHQNMLAAKNNKITDQEIHDTVLVAAFFCMCNRYVDGCGAKYSTKENVRAGGFYLAKHGYRMGK